MLYKTIITSHVFLAVCLILLVLLQKGKGADMGSGFGAGASGTVFGARGSSTFFSKTTGILAMLFFFTSLGLAYLSGKQTGPESIVDQVQDKTQIESPEMMSDEPIDELAVDDLPVLPDLPVEEPLEETEGDGSS